MIEIEDIVDRIATSESTDPLLLEASTEIQYLRAELAREIANRYKARGTGWMIEFRVPGIAAPQGSKKAFRTRGGRIALVESCARVKPYRATVALAAREVWAEGATHGVGGRVNRVHVCAAGKPLQRKGRTPRWRSDPPR